VFYNNEVSELQISEKVYQMNIIKSSIKNLLNKMGYIIVKKRSNVEVIDKYILTQYCKKDDYLQRYAEAIGKAGLKSSDNFFKQRRYYSVYQMVNHVINKGISGDFSECGCWKGHSTYMISKLLQDNGFSQTFHIFDSFEGGLSDKSEEDKNLREKLTEAQIKKEKMLFSNTEEDVKKLLSDFKFVKLYPGWIPERFHEVSNRTFSFVFIDVDLYQPTLESLNFFYPRLSKGGVIVIDDYGYSQFPGAAIAVDSLLNKNKPSICFADSMGSFIIIK